MTQTKIEGKFYPLTPETAKKLRDNLTITEWKLWSYLTTLDPFGDRYQDLPPLVDVLVEVGISKASFYRAIARFQELKLFDFQAEIKFRRLSSETKVSAARQKSQQRDKSLSSETKISAVRQKSQQRENQPLQPASEADFSPSQTIQTYSDFIQTLSESEGERFFEFVRKQIENLPKPINDVAAWLACRTAAGDNRWEVYYKLFLDSQQTSQKPKQHRPLRDEIEQRRREVMEKLRKEKEAQPSATETGQDNSPPETSNPSEPSHRPKPNPLESPIPSATLSYEKTNKPPFAEASQSQPPRPGSLREEIEQQRIRAMKAYEEARQNGQTAPAES